MPPVGFEPTISAGERPQTYALDRTDTVTGTVIVLHLVCILNFFPRCQIHIRKYAIMLWGTRWRSWLRHCATNRKVTGSVSDGVTGIFH